MKFSQKGTSSMSEQRQPADAAAPERNPWLILFVLCGAVFMLLSFLSVLDRLNALEKRDAFS